MEKFSELDAKLYAKEMAKSVVIRSYKDGNSNDVRRKSTKKEAEIIECAIYSALCAIRGGYDEQSAKATAEYMVLYNSGETHINSYDSVYIPIGAFLKKRKSA